MRRLASPIAFLTIAYAGSVAAWQALRLAAGDRWWWLALANSVSLYLLLPGAVLCPAAWWSRRRVAIVAGAVPVAALLVLYGGLFLPRIPGIPWSRSAAGGERLRVMTFNVLGANRDAGPVERVIRDAAPDVVCLQELNPRLGEDLAARVAADYPYAVFAAGGGQPRVGVLSRFPLRDEGEIVDEAARQGARAVTLDWNGRSVLVLSAHGAQFGLFRGVRSRDPGQMASAARVRADQIRLWLDRIAAHQGPAILCGDLNMTDQNGTYRLLAARMKDAFREAGWGFGHTFPAAGGMFPVFPFPGRLLRLDYVWATPDWQVVSARVLKWDGQSDHLPVIAELEGWKDGRSEGWKSGRMLPILRLPLKGRDHV